jgi:DNA-binding NarL/FixJ family response regulator
VAGEVQMQRTRRDVTVKVLIADGNRLILEGFRRALDGFSDIEIVGATHSGAQLLELIERRRPEVVALDLDLCDESGRSCLDAVVHAHPEIKVVVLSSSSLPEHIRSALSRGARAFIVKSVNPLDIPSALRQAHEETVYHAFGFQETPEDGLRSAGLTEREITMLKSLARGLSNKAISRELWLSEPTVKFHLGNLYRKLGVPNRLAAASFAHSHGISDAGHGIAA